jgi:hypothetical protein
MEQKKERIYFDSALIEMPKAEILEPDTETASIESICAIYY